MGHGWLYPRDPEGFGRWLVERRKARGMSAVLVALIIRMPLQNFLDLERGTRRVYLNTGNARALARAIGCRLAQLEEQLRRSAV